MKSHPTKIACVLVFTAFAVATGAALDNPATGANTSLAPFEFNREPAESPEAAARTLFRGVSTGSPAHFVQHLLLGVCDGPIATLQKFAESLHETKFRHNGDSFTYYDIRELRKGFDHKKPVRVVATVPFDTGSNQVAALQFQRMSTYYGQAFVCIEAAAESYDGVEYQTRIVVAQVDGGWYAMPRCRSAKSFYEIADAMRIAPPAANGAK